MPAALLARAGTAGANGQPSIGSRRSGGSPGRPPGASRDARVAQGRERPPRARACRGGSGVRDDLAATARSRPAGRRTSPRCRSQVWASTDRSWLIMISEMPRSRTRSVSRAQDLGLHDHVEGGGRLVGDHQVGDRRPAPSPSSRAVAGRRRAHGGSCSTGARGRRRCRAATRARASGLLLSHLLVQQDRLDDLVADRSAPG